MASKWRTFKPSDGRKVAVEYVDYAGDRVAFVRSVDGETNLSAGDVGEVEAVLDEHCKGWRLPPSS